jgi:preprotein translocase subunit YajC
LFGYKEDVLKTSNIYMLLVFVAFIAFFYFMAIRPQSKQRKAHQEMMNSLTKGDVVMTASGIYGKVAKVDDTVVVIEIAKGVTMKVTRRAIADIIRDKDRIKALALEGSAAGTGSRGSRTAKTEAVEVSESEIAGDASDNVIDKEA